MLQLKKVSKSYGETVALRETSLHCKPGETTALLGPSGCGKSTLLRIVVGLVEPDSGEVIFDGEPITKQNLLQVRRKMGYVIQSGGLFPHLTCADNVTLMAKRLGWKPDRIDARIKELAALTHLPIEALDRYPIQISGGQRQRVSLIRAMFLDPNLILLDEPMGALDPLIRSELQAELRQIFTSLKKTVLMVTHDIGEAGVLADSIALLKAGDIIQNGSLEALVKEPAHPFVSEFINAQRSPLETISGDSP